MKGIESHLPENVERRVNQQLTDAQKQTSRYQTALWHLTCAYGFLTVPPLPISRADDVTLHQLAIARKCVEADLAQAKQTEQSAYHVYCEALGLDPDEGNECGPDPMRDGWVGKDGRP